MTEACFAAVERERLLALLDAAQARSIPLPFWWRDDDAETATPQLERLLAVRLDLPLALAVVPKRATAELSARLAGENGVWVLQHGWSHENHSPPGEKKMELGDHRPAEMIRDQLRRGFERLSALFPDRFLPALAPPWNRIGEAAKTEMHSAGLLGLSTFGPVDPADPHRANVHLDIFTGKPRRPLPPAEAYAALSREIARRLDSMAIAHADAAVPPPRSGGGGPARPVEGASNPFSRREKVSPKATDEGVPAGPNLSRISTAGTPSSARFAGTFSPWEKECRPLHDAADGPPPPSLGDGGGTQVPPNSKYDQPGLHGATEPIGIMTHHLAHTEESWMLLDELFGLLRAHPAVSWPPITAIFGLAPAPR